MPSPTSFGLPGPAGHALPAPPLSLMDPLKARTGAKTAPGATPRTRPYHLGLRVLAAAKIAKGICLVGVGMGIFSLIHRNLDEVVLAFLQFARITPENHYAQLLLEKAGLIQPGTIFQVGVGTLVVACLDLAEGLGLWYQRRWAELLVIVATGVFVPEEFMFLVHRPTLTHLSVLLLNMIVLGYVIRLAVKRRQAAAADEAKAKAE